MQPQRVAKLWQTAGTVAFFSASVRRVDRSERSCNLFRRTDGKILLVIWGDDDREGEVVHAVIGGGICRSREPDGAAGEAVRALLKAAGPLAVEEVR